MSGKSQSLRYMKISTVKQAREMRVPIFPITNPIFNTVIMACETSVNKQWLIIMSKICALSHESSLTRVATHCSTVCSNDENNCTLKQEKTNKNES